MLLCEEGYDSGIISQTELCFLSDAEQFFLPLVIVSIVLSIVFLFFCDPFSLCNSRRQAKCPVNNDETRGRLFQFSDDCFFIIYGGHLLVFYDSHCFLTHLDQIIFLCNKLKLGGSIFVERVPSIQAVPTSMMIWHDVSKSRLCVADEYEFDLSQPPPDACSGDLNSIFNRCEQENSGRTSPSLSCSDLLSFDLIADQDEFDLSEPPPVVCSDNLNSI